MLLILSATLLWGSPLYSLSKKKKAQLAAEAAAKEAEEAAKAEAEALSL
jgi:hypothetical protein